MVFFSSERIPPSLPLALVSGVLVSDFDLECGLVSGLTLNSGSGISVVGVF